MKIRTWNLGMTDKETADLAYWERNVLALYLADGWYNDDIPNPLAREIESAEMVPRYQGWRRILSIGRGQFTFHIPDDFDVGTLPQIEPNWDGHTTEEKWQRMLKDLNVAVTA